MSVLQSNPFKVLGVSLFPKDAEIKSQFNKKQVQFGQLKAAYDFLLDNQKMTSLRNVMLHNAELGEKTDFASEITRINRNSEKMKEQ